MVKKLFDTKDDASLLVARLALAVMVGGGGKWSVDRAISEKLG